MKGNIGQTSRLMSAVRAVRRLPHTPRLLPLTVALSTVLVLTACTGAASLNNERGWSGPLIAEGVVYVGSRDGELLALDLPKLQDQTIDLRNEEFSVIWRFPDARDEDLRDVVRPMYGQPILDGERIYVAINRSDDNLGEVGTVFGLERETGLPLLDWRVPLTTEGSIFGNLALADGVIYAADDQGFVYAVDAENGQPKWRIQVSDERFWSSPLVVDGILYIGGMDRRFYALDVEQEGALAWPPFKARGAIASQPAILDDLLYVGDFDGRLYAIDRNTGRAVHEFEGDNWFWNDAIVHDGLVYVGTLGGDFYALTPELTEVWRFPPLGSQEEGEAIRGAAIVVGDSIFFGTRQGTVRGLDLKNGAPSSRAFTTRAKSLAPLGASQGRVYVHDFDDMLQIFNVLTDRSQ